jgi:hypothetical protein
MVVEIAGFDNLYGVEFENIQFPNHKCWDHSAHCFSNPQLTVLFLRCLS